MDIPIPIARIAVKTEALAHHAVDACPNCDAVVSGNFCHQCGQETVLHPPSAREFMHEFIGHYVALEGKLLQSLRLLLLRPGQLTLEYIEGRRVRYVQPLRIYLTFSIIFFAVLKFGAGDSSDVNVGVGKKHGAPATVQHDGHGEDSNAGADGKVGIVHEDQEGEIRKGTESLREAVGKVSPHSADKLGHFADMSNADRGKLIKTALYAYTPYAIFLMMPLFALYLKVLYLGAGRRYGEHLLFALHVNAFAFLALTLMSLVPDGFGLVEFALLVWLAFYLPLAMRRVYGGGRVITALRWIVLMVFHLVTMGLALLGVMAFGMLH
jgi:hypothetical protein